MARRSDTIRDLDEALRARDPRARVVAPRIIRRILKQEEGLGLLGLGMSHRRSVTVGALAAVRAAGPKALDLPEAPASGELLFLIQEPDRHLAEGPADLLRLWGWRRLFHARVHAEIADRIASGMLDTEAVRGRIAAIGAVEFAEIRGVLAHDSWLIGPTDDAIGVYEEFVAVYSELRQFDECALTSTFPGLGPKERIDAILARDLDGGAILAATRPDGSAEPKPRPDRGETPDDDDSPDRPAPRSEARARRLLARADRVRSAGNVVRSAILRAEAARLVGPGRAGQARSGAARDLDELASRLAAALECPDTPKSSWRPALASLLSRSLRTALTVEARLLFDLQSACLDHEREVFQVDLFGWATSLGRRPLKRRLPNQSLVRMSHHLKSASGRVPRARLPEAERRALRSLLRKAEEATEHRLRERFRPMIARVMERSHVRPANLPERVSFDRMTEELIDRIADHKSLTMGDLRDAMARSDLKQPDRRSFRGWFGGGNRVLQADRRFAKALDGVYHRGEVYLRFVQQASYFIFSTPEGRWFTRYLALPYGGAFGALVTVEELLGLIRIHVEWKRWEFVLALGTFFLALILSPRLREAALAGLKRAGRGLKLGLIDAPAWLLARPWIRDVLRSRGFDVARRIVLIPLLSGGVTFAIVRVLDPDRRVGLAIAAVVVAALTLLGGTRLGTDLEARVADLLRRGYVRLRSDFLPGVFKWIVDLFAALLEAVERAIYAVDERLRFRSGQGRLALWSKAVAGLFWAAITYVIRIFVNLLVEPQVNPVKHFPTVTVAAKMLIPKYNSLFHGIADPLWFLGEIPAGAIAGMTVFFLPGLAGFVVWELKENWRLFKANRPATLRPTMIGHHGETMRRLILPGFHSGTIPKLFAKLRRAERDAFWTGDLRRVRTARRALHHVEHPIEQFLGRGFLAILSEGGVLGERRWSIADVTMATNRVVVAFAVDGEPGHPLVVTFLGIDHRLVARVEQGPTIDALPERERDAFHMALRGCLGQAGVELEGADASPAPFDSPTWAGWVRFWDERPKHVDEPDARPATPMVSSPSGDSGRIS